MPRSILASLTGLGTDRAVLEAALAVARIEGGHVTCLHARIDVIETAARIEVMFPQDHEGQTVIRQITEEEEERSRRARVAFEDVRKVHVVPLLEGPKDDVPVSMSWKETRSFFNETLEEARYHDLVVMTGDAGMSRERLKTVLVQSGRPLLLAPAKPIGPIGRNIAIAWKEGAEAARAVTVAMPFLTRAEKVSILSISTDQAGDDTSRLSAERLGRSLRWHGIHAQIRMEYVSSSPGARNLQTMAYDQNADLLVMGAYGHSRLREYVLGGVTEDMLMGCAIPVLMFS